MPAVSSVALLSSIAWLVLIRSGIGTVTFGLVALVAATHLASIVLAVTGCMPINRQLMAWNAASPPEDVMAIWSRWEHVNAIRTILAIIGFVSLAVTFVFPN